MGNIVISVIVPAYNSSRSILVCLGALRNQSFSSESYEVIVVDDGSTDDTALVAESTGVQVIRQAHLGPAAARNLGVKQARGEIILFTDADCEADFYWIEEMSRPIREDTSICGVKGVYRTRQSSLVARFAQIEFEERYKLLKSRDSIDFVDSHAAAFRKDVFEKVGGFDLNFPVANNEDVELSYKIAHAGYRMVFNDRAIVYHTHPDTVRKYLKTKLLRAYWRVKVYEKFPNKMVSDSYTPQTLKLEIFFSGLFLLFGILSFWYIPFIKVSLLSLLAFLLCCISFISFAAARDVTVAITSPLFLLGRSVVFVLGVLAGSLSKKRRDILVPALLVLVDVITCAAALILAYWIRAVLLRAWLPRFDHSIHIYMTLYPMIVLMWLGVFYSRGLYKSTWVRTPLTEYLRILESVSQVILIIIAFSFFIKWDFSRPMIVIYWICGCTLSLITRSIVRGIQKPMISKGYNAIRTLIVGGGETAQLVINRLTHMPNSLYRVIGYIDAPTSKKEMICSVPYIGSLDEIVSIIPRETIDEVIIAQPELTHQQTLDLIARCDHTGVSFRIVSDLFDILSRGANIDEAFHLPVVDIREVRSSRLVWMGKLALDYGLGFFLTILAIPVMMIIGLLIYQSNRRFPVISQPMVGYKGAIFHMFRFFTDPNARGFAGSISRWLQRTHLDELPQLLNVLKGDMSLVGPRPEHQEIVAHYDEWQKRRVLLKPGITGLWQVYSEGGRPLHEDLELDFYYIKNSSLLLDISILIKTLPIIFFGKRE